MIAKLLRLGLILCALPGFAPTAHAAEGTVLTVSRTGNTLSGSLNTVFGGPVLFQNITVSTVDTNARLGLVTESVSGTTPAAAANAQVGIVIGENGACVCNGAAAAVVGGLSYSDSGHQDSVKVVATAFPTANVAMSVRTFSMQPGQTLNENLGQFAVSPGSAFTFSAPMMATANASQAGYAYVTFTDAGGHTLSTSQIWFTPGQQTLTTVNTGGTGGFSLTLPAHVNLADPEISVSFPGNLIYAASNASAAPLGLNPANTMPAVQQPVTGIGTSSAPMIWMSPQPDFITDVNNQGWSTVYGEWNQAASHTKIMRFPVAWLSTFSQDNLAQLVADMNANGISLVLEIQANNDWSAPGQPALCGGGMESFSDPGTANQVIAQLMAAGANLAMVVMDEPFYFGMYAPGTNACYGSAHGTVADEIGRATQLLSLYQAAFPNLIYGDIEPFPATNNGTSNGSTWTTDYPAFISGVQSQMGIQIPFMHMDINWDDTTRIPDAAHLLSLVQSVAGVIRGHGMKLGFIANGTSSASSDSTWMTTAESHISCVIDSGVKPEQWAFESWVSHPALTVPETNSSALTYLIDYYENQVSGHCP